MKMDKFFFPKSVAVFGVSDTTGNLGRSVVENLDRFGYKGQVYAVGRTEKMVRGKKVMKDLDGIREIPDLAVIVVPAHAIPDVLKVCGKKGIRHAIIEAAGFSESGEEKKTLEEEILQVAREADITIVGPNCLGVINLENRLCVPFVPFTYDEIGEGPNSFVTQSGGLLHDVMHRCSADNIGMNKLVSIGNKMMVDENDMLQFLIDDPGTHVIGMHLESISDGRRLMQLASETTKPIVVLKANESQLSSEIASFHTAALLGDNAVANAAFKQAGIQRVQSIQDMVDCFKIFSMPLMKGPNLVIISRSGGQAVLLADEAHRHHFLLPPPPPVFLERVTRHTKAGVIRNTNPVDLGDVWDELFYLEAIEMALWAKEVDAVMFYFEHGTDSSIAYEILKGIEELSQRYQKPVVLCMVPNRLHWFDLRYSRHYPFFTESERAFRSIQRSYDHYKKIMGSFKGVLAVKSPEAPVMRGDIPKILPAAETFALLKEYEIPVVEYELVRTKEDGLQAARRIGYPVVLKRIEPFILHKTEAGAVRVNLGNDDALGAAFNEMHADVYIVQKMAMGGVETILGGKRDPQFGPVVVFGLGGIYVEVLGDATTRVAPIDEPTAMEMIDEIKGSALLHGARGAHMADMKVLSKTLVNLSKLMADHPEIQNLDMNPFRVFERGQGGVALDIKIEYINGKKAVV